MEDSLDIIQYREKKSYAINLSLLLIYSLYFGQVDFNFGQGRKSGPTCPWTTEESPYFHTAAEDLQGLKMNNFQYITKEKKI